MNFGMMTAPASANPSDASIDYIMRDAMACANAGITGIGNIAKAGVGLYNAMGNMFSNPMGMMSQQNMIQLLLRMKKMNLSNEKSLKIPTKK